LSPLESALAGWCASRNAAAPKTNAIKLNKRRTLALISNSTYILTIGRRPGNSANVQHRGADYGKGSLNSVLKARGGHGNCPRPCAASQLSGRKGTWRGSRCRL